MALTVWLEMRFCAEMGSSGWTQCRGNNFGGLIARFHSANLCPSGKSLYSQPRVFSSSVNDGSGLAGLWTCEERDTIVSLHKSRLAGAPTSSHGGKRTHPFHSPPQALSLGPIDILDQIILCCGG